MIFSPLQGIPLVTQGFGQNPADYAAYGMNGHNGIDFGCPEGTRVFAPHDGKITVKDEGTSGYGKSVTIDDSKRRSLLAHLSQIDVQDGKNIAQGDPIGLSGMTGNVTGPHLHWTYKLLSNGQVLNGDNGYQGAMDVTEFVRLWEDNDLHRDANYADSAQEYLTMTFPANQYLKRIV